MHGVLAWQELRPVLEVRCDGWIQAAAFQSFKVEPARAGLRDGSPVQAQQEARGDEGATASIA
ncbi:MAG: hypothetical protein ACN6O0_04870 [Achromobacter spanius]